MLDDRETRNGRVPKQYPELDSAQIMTLYTKCPEKWLLVDRETGEVYQGNSLGSWDRIVLDQSMTDEERLKNAKRIQH